MKNLFEQGTVDEVISRIDKLQAASERQWGKMDAAQMMAHCSATMDMASGRLNLPRIFIGRILGPLVKPIYTNEKPFSRNSPTDKKFVIADQRDFAREQEQLKLKVRSFMRAGKRSARAIRIRFLARSPRRRGPADRTNIWIITCGSSGREAVWRGRPRPRDLEGTHSSPPAPLHRSR